MKSDTGKRMSGTGDLFGRKLKNSPNPKRLKNSPVDPYKKGMSESSMRTYDILRNPNAGMSRKYSEGLSGPEAREAVSSSLDPVNVHNEGGISDFEKLKREVKRQRASKK